MHLSREFRKSFPQKLSAAIVDSNERAVSLSCIQKDVALINKLRARFNKSFTPDKYAKLLECLNRRCGASVDFRIAETPIFVPLNLLNQMAEAGARLTAALLGNAAYLEAARGAIPAEYRVAGETPKPNFLTADFALIRNSEGAFAPRLVEIQAFPSVYAYQIALCSAYREAFALDLELDCFLSGLTEETYLQLLGKTIVGKHDPRNVVLTEFEPQRQKTLPDFVATASRLGIAVVDIRSLEAIGDKLHYRDPAGRLVPIHRIYNRAIADELMARQVRLPFDLTRGWDVEWAGHPNWYFLISKFSIPWLSRPPCADPVVPPAVFLSDFLAGPGRAELASAGVNLPSESGPETVYSELLLKPLFSFAGKGIRFDPTQEQLNTIPTSQRSEFLLQQRMHFEPTIETPHGPTQAEFRILYLWPDDGELTPALTLVRLGRGKMMGVDHNRGQQWVGASAAFFPAG